MSTNPNNAIGTNGAYGGRTSVNAFNDNLAIYQGRGILSGFAVSPNAGMSVAIGGDGTTRDVAIAEDNIGNKTTINNISESPVVLNIAGAPASNSRIDAIVAYVDNPAQGTATETDNPSACGLIDVQGAVSASPSRPDENAIRTAITADGASGTTAYYVVLGYITIVNGTTDITSNMISVGSQANIQSNSISFATYTTTEQAVGTWINGKPLYRKVVDTLTGTSGNNTFNLTTVVDANIDRCYHLDAVIWSNTSTGLIPPYFTSAQDYFRAFVGGSNVLTLALGSAYTSTVKFRCVFYYTKTTD